MSLCRLAVFLCWLWTAANPSSLRPVFRHLRFKRYDQSQDGVLDRREVKQVLKQMGYMTLSCKEMGGDEGKAWVSNDSW